MAVLARWGNLHLFYLWMQKWMGPTKQWLWLADMLHQGFLSFLMHGILCDMFDNLPSISAPYLYICVFLSFGCWCCLAILFYLLRDVLTFPVCFMNMFDSWLNNNAKWKQLFQSVVGWYPKGSVARSSVFKYINLVLLLRGRWVCGNQRP